MIKNERQYRITKAQAAKFADALTNFRTELVEPLHPLLIKAHEDALKSQMADLEEELREYESLRAGNFDWGELNVIAELPKALIRARIAKRLSQKDLADALGMKEQQIQRYEATEYASASLARITEVVQALGGESESSRFVEDDNH
ncbi:MAG: helix-turn-helix domain-containing protein [SAR202 cluster bacterium]|jgi:DNA-binding Xre family transcriptional regulator|nr:transcriptional regulator [Chloroflexota bacterium]MDP6420042.1 helix-turn-helix transcriptional regulator [SAR202 cluster bacterium]HAL47943.1 transcriptional regulator [Dehalococcoidia bacterium]MDP6663164.1 helix-turn-helix transcriptional regulator [SAR202 cluster bacterium]MQG59637.1 helix-turn-helix domain-containing protein [SAR202 cluster bacterium]|tara:strand:+ start:3324 stop:3761 length:438 start_codon:yes stop_codon:yes gene_type:complete